MPAPAAEHPSHTVSGCLYAAHGAYMILAGLILAVMSWLIPLLLVKVVSSDVVDTDQLPRVARWMLERRELMPLLALPVIVFGLIAVNRVRWPLLWAILGLVSMLVPAALLVYTFVVSIGLLYRVQEI